MRRRSVLASVGTLVVAGCTGSGGGGLGSTTTASSTKSTTSTTSSRPGVGEASLSVTGSGCGSEGAGGATVSFDVASVVVSGTVVGNNGCYLARLVAVTYDSRHDTFRVVVEAYDASEPGQLCSECITTVEYEATVAFEGGMPGTVEVVHDDVGGRSTVATASP